MAVRDACGEIFLVRFNAKKFPFTMNTTVAQEAALGFPAHGSLYFANAPVEASSKISSWGVASSLVRNDQY